MHTGRYQYKFFSWLVCACSSKLNGIVQKTGVGKWLQKWLKEGSNMASNLAFKYGFKKWLSNMASKMASNLT